MLIQQSIVLPIFAAAALAFGTLFYFKPSWFLWTWQIGSRMIEPDEVRTAGVFFYMIAVVLILMWGFDSLPRTR